MTSGIVTTGDGCRIAYRLDGVSDLPVLVLSNSLGTTLAMWEAQVARFARRFRILRYDSRGHGASDRPSGAYGMDRLGRDVVELADALEIARFSFCGLSMGGMVGQWLGWRYPVRLDRLVLASTSAYMGPEAGWDARIAAVRAGGVAMIADAVLSRWFTPAFLARASPEFGAMRQMLLQADAGGYAGCCAAIRDMDQRALLRLVSAPTLVIGGESDPATPPDHARLLAAKITGAELIMLDAAHLSNVERPAAFADAVLRFLTAG